MSFSTFLLNVFCDKVEIINIQKANRNKVFFKGSEKLMEHCQHERYIVYCYIPVTVPKYELLYNYAEDLNEHGACHSVIVLWTIRGKVKLTL